ncbi:MAG TPA: twin-arginine translocation pathway signal protein, partial [Sulfitobacter sp.]|nr:twin-arginine translocation pathway signal protein [Sulfitobacter sp.]
AEPKLKEAKDFTLIGTDVPKLDTHAKTTGQAEYTMDVYREGMETVVVAHPDKMGAVVASFDDTDALKVPGVIAVREIPQGVAVYAKTTGAALKGREALQVTWDDSKAETRSSAQIYADFSRAAAEGGRAAEEVGDAMAGIDGAAQVIEAEFHFPYLAHAALEPLDAVLEVTDG